VADSIQQGFLRDEDGNLVVTGGDGVTGKMDYGFIRDEATRALVVVGPGGEPIGGNQAAIDDYTKRLAVASDKNNRRIFHDDGLLANWTKVEPAGEWTEVSESVAGAGGGIIKFAGSSAGAKLESKPAPGPFNATALRPPVGRPFIVSTELSLSSAGCAALSLYNASTKRAMIRLGNGGTGKVEIQTGGAAEDVSSKLTEWVKTGRWARILIWIDPVGLKARFYIYYTSTANKNLGKHQFLGEMELAGSLASMTIKIESGTTSEQTIEVKGTRAYEVFQVANGCSTDLAHLHFDISPNAFREEGERDARADAPLALSYRLNGDRDWPVNHARGGYLVKEMLEEFDDMVAKLQPRFVNLGSATNSVGAVVQETLTMAELKAEYLEMVEKALEIDTDGQGTPPLVMATTIAPRHDSPNFTTVAHREKLQEFNDWMRTTLPPLGVVLRDIWDVLVTSEMKLVSWADAGEHLHWTVRGVQVTAEIGAHALQEVNLS
jgi:hypothetical protein